MFENKNVVFMMSFWNKAHQTCQWSKNWKNK